MRQNSVQATKSMGTCKSKSEMNLAGHEWACLSTTLIFVYRGRMCATTQQEKEKREKLVFPFFLFSRPPPFFSFALHRG